MSGETQALIGRAHRVWDTAVRERQETVTVPAADFGGLVMAAVSAQAAKGVRSDPPAPPAEPYPGLWVDERVKGGAATFGGSMTPVHAVVGELVCGFCGWDGVESEYQPSRHGWDDERFAEFLGCLLDQSGAVARLLLTAADAERRARARERTATEAAAAGEALVDVSPWDPDAVALPPPWWDDPDLRAPVVAQLRRCLDALEPVETDR